MMRFLALVCSSVSHLAMLQGLTSRGQGSGRHLWFLDGQRSEWDRANTGHV